MSAVRQNGTAFTFSRLITHIAMGSSPSHSGTEYVLNLRAGEFVLVRTSEEILATLDRNGALDSLPFMPEMLQYCGKAFRVNKRADKTCDTITGTNESRRLNNTVHLENLRCGGEAHGECDAMCLLFWKEAWLQRMEASTGRDSDARDGSCTTSDARARLRPSPSSLRESALYSATKVSNPPTDHTDTLYRCQATELLRASQPMYWWDIRQYAREVHFGNVRLADFLRISCIAILNVLHAKVRGWRRIPMLDSHLMGKNSGGDTQPLSLQPGEYVQIKSKYEIIRTLDKRQRHRGLYFDKEMVKYCGRTARVLKRVHKIINEGTGKLIHLKNDCVILEGVVCCGEFSEKRLFCPRGIYPFWREIWLKRI